MFAALLHDRVYELSRDLGIILYLYVVEISSCARRSELFNFHDVTLGSVSSTFRFRESGAILRYVLLINYLYGKAFNVYLLVRLEPTFYRVM